MHGIYGKAPLTALIRQGRGRALAIGTTNDLSICSTANHGPPSRSGPGASAPPSPIVNAALHTGAQFLSKKIDDNDVEHEQECGDTISVSKDSYFNLKRHIMRKHDSVLREHAEAKREHFEYG